MYSWKNPGNFGGSGLIRTLIERRHQRERPSIMLCYVVLYYVNLCYVVLCCAVILCQFMFCLLCCVYVVYYVLYVKCYAIQEMQH